MATKIQVYKVKDFIRMSKSGEIDLERSMEIIHKLVAAASFYADHNILVDLRETTVGGNIDIGTVMQLALEMARYGSAFKGKIANVVPGDERRLSIARHFETSVHLHGLKYKVFTNFEDAVDWLSDITELGVPPSEE